MAERREKFETSSAIELPADFNPTNINPVNYAEDLGAPGDYPYTRQALEAAASKTAAAMRDGWKT